MGTQNSQGVRNLQPVVTTPEMATRVQVDILLDLVHHLQPCCITPEDGSAGKLDGGTQSAAQAALIKVFDRIEKLVEADNRWSVDSVNGLIKEMTLVQQKQQVFLDEQSKSTSEVRRPSFQLRPNLFLHETLYYAVWGEFGGPSSVVGSGTTPQEAMLDFDAAFFRRAEEQTRLEVETAPPEEPIPETPVTFKPKKKKKL